MEFGVFCALVLSVAALALSTLALVRTMPRRVAPPAVERSARDLRSDVGRLDPQAKRHLESAAGHALRDARDSVDVAHWLHAMVQDPGPELSTIWREFGVAADRLREQLQPALQRVAPGSGGAPALAAGTLRLLVASIELADETSNARAVTPGHVLCALLRDDVLRRQLGPTPALDTVAASALHDWLVARGAAVTGPQTAAPQA